MKKGQRYHCKRCVEVDRELAWSRACAGLRGQCDYCKADMVLLSRNVHGLWNCFKCFVKMDTPISTGRGNYNQAITPGNSLLPKTANPVQSERQHEET